MLLVSANCKTRLEARRLKTMAPSLADIVVWHDCNIRPVRRDLREWVESQLDGYDVAASKHPVRDCIYEEARVCELLEKASPLDLKRQVRYCKTYVAPHSGLWELGVMFWRRSNKVIQACEQWWLEQQDYTLRDQISFPGIVKQFDLKVNTLGHCFRGGNKSFAIDE